MTTVAELIPETRQHFQGALREQVNFLGDDIDETDTSISVDDDLGPIGSGAVLSMGLERMLVRAAASQANISVKRGWDGTTPIAHVEGDVVRANARVDDWAVLRAFNNELSSLSSPNKGLFRVRTVELTFDPSRDGYDLTSAGAVIGAPLAVWAQGYGAGEWVRVPAGEWLYNAVASPDDFSSGRSLTLVSGFAGYPVRVVLRSPFRALTALSQDVSAQSGLPATATDLLPMGAALQLATGRPFERSDMGSQGNARRGEEVSTQDTLIAATGLRGRYEDRIRDEAFRLVAEHGQAI